MKISNSWCWALRLACVAILGACGGGGGGSPESAGVDTAGGPTIVGFDDGKSAYSTRDRRPLSAAVIYSDKSSVPAPTPTWSSSNAGVFAIDSAGNFQASGVGTARVTATYGSLTASRQVTIVTPASAPSVTVSCDPAHPTVISAQAWNTLYAQDPHNSTEWIVVDGASCRASAQVELLVPSELVGALYTSFFRALRSAANPNVFLAGAPGSTGDTPQVSPGHTVSVGSVAAGDKLYFSELYTFNVE